MTITCQETRTISSVSQSICGHLVRIYDIKAIYPSTIDVVVDGYLIPAIGSTGVSTRFDNYYVKINLVSKNVGAGTAVITFAHDTIEDTGATHYFDLTVKPYSWYGPGGATDWLLGKAADINGAILDVFSSLGVTDYTYIGTDIIEDEPVGYVTIRVKLKQIAAMSAMTGSEIQSLYAWYIPIVIALAIVVIGIGLIIAYRFYQVTGQLIGEKKYTKGEVVDLTYNKVTVDQMAECEKNFSDPIQQAECKKSVICGAANGITDALGLTGTDCNTLGINQKIDACTAQYRIDGDQAKYKSCISNVNTAAGAETKAKTPKEMDWGEILLLGLLFVGGIYVFTR